MQSRDDVRRSSGRKGIVDFFEFVSAVFVDGCEIAQNRCLVVELHESQSIAVFQIIDDKLHRLLYKPQFLAVHRARNIDQQHDVDSHAGFRVVGFRLESRHHRQRTDLGSFEALLVESPEL